MIEIPAGHKYATVALHITHRLNLQHSDPLDVGDGIWVTSQMPMALPDHWRGWLGSLQVEDLKRANFFIFTSRNANNLDSLDHENEELKRIVHRMYFAILMAAPYVGHDQGARMTGAHHEGTLAVRQFEPNNEVLVASGCHGAICDDTTFHLAKRIYDGLAQVEGGGEHDRLWRVVHAFYEGLQENQLGDRLHQFIRCVEGFVFPNEGNTRKHMTSRTELFLGPSQHALMQTMFDIRSAVEHLHGPARVISEPSRRESDLKLAELSFKSEALARYCLRRVFTTPHLWPHFCDDDALAVFWASPPTQRTEIWGAPMGITTDFAHFSRATASIQFEH